MHSQRLSLKGEFLLSSSILKKFLNLIFFNLAPLLVEVKVPSKDLKKDFFFNKQNIIYKPNIIFSKNKINFKISKKK